MTYLANHINVSLEPLSASLTRPASRYTALAALLMHPTSCFHDERDGGSGRH